MTLCWQPSLHHVKLQKYVKHFLLLFLPIDDETASVQVLIFAFLRASSFQAEPKIISKCHIILHLHSTVLRHPSYP